MKNKKPFKKIRNFVYTIVQEAKDNGTFEESYSKLAAEMNIIGGAAAIALFIIECLTGVSYIITGEISSWNEISRFITKYVMRTFLLIGVFEFLLMILKRLLLKKSNFNEVYITKLFSMVGLTCITCAIPYVHYVYPSTYGMPIVVIFISTVYADRLLTIITSLYALLMTALSFIDNARRVNDMPVDWQYSMAIAFIMLIASTLISMKIISIEISKEKEQIRVCAMRDRIEADSNKDALTKLWNFKKLNEELKKKCDSLKIAMIDIDNFKHINDTYGHDFGNIVLKRLGRILLSEETDTIKVGRYGGEEFTIVSFGETTQQEFEVLLNNIRLAFGSQEYRELNSNENITISIGYADSELTRVNKGTELIKLADKALYAAKRSTKNTVVRYSIEGIKKALKYAKTYYAYKIDLELDVDSNDELTAEIQQKFRVMENMDLSSDDIKGYCEVIEQTLNELEQS